MNKNELRAKMLKIRQKLSSEARVQAEKDLVDAILALDLWKQHHQIGIYRSTSQELSTRLLIEAGWDQGKSIYLPTLQPGQQEMGFSHFRPNDKLVRNIFGIDQPDASKKDDSQRLSLIIVPAVCVDARGHRLGYGKGFYDRFLRGSKGRLATIAIAFACNRVEKIPNEPHDMKCDLSVTV